MICDTIFYALVHVCTAEYGLDLGYKPHPHLNAPFKRASNVLWINDFHLPSLTIKKRHGPLSKLCRQFSSVCFFDWLPEASLLYTICVVTKVSGAVWHSSHTENARAKWSRTNMLYLSEQCSTVELLLD